MREDAEISRVPTDRAAKAGESQRVPVCPSPQQTQALNASSREHWLDDQGLAATTGFTSRALAMHTRPGRLRPHWTRQESKPWPRFALAISADDSPLGQPPRQDPGSPQVEVVLGKNSAALFRP